MAVLLIFTNISAVMDRGEEEQHGVKVLNAWNAEICFPPTWKANMKQHIQSEVWQWNCKVQSQSVEAELVDQSVYLPSTPDLTEIPTHGEKVSTVRKVFILNQRLNSYDSIKPASSSSSAEDSAVEL